MPVPGRNPLPRRSDPFPTIGGRVIKVALTGGIGSGKSSVAELLAEHGALVIDADAIARDLVQPGQPALAEIVAEFGQTVLLPDGTLDRAGLAAIVFGHDDRLAALNSIMHPRIARRTAELMSAAPPGAVVVYDMALLVEQGVRPGWDHVVVVEAPARLRLERLARDRGIAPDDARARMEAQASDDQRRAVADTVIVNDGDRDQLAAAVDALWTSLVG